jgi:Zn finger protein HypA/HybF involved in hydrogenase expression
VILRIINPITRIQLREVKKIRRNFYLIRTNKGKILKIYNDYKNKDVECDECEDTIEDNEIFFICDHCKDFTICRSCEQSGKHGKHLMMRVIHEVRLFFL